MRISLLISFSCLSAALAVAAPVAPAPAAAAARRPGTAPHVTASVLPDSVLARIDGREDITRRRYTRAVRLLGGDPDSLTPGSRDQFLELVLEQRLLAARVVKDPRPWAREDSAQFLSERDNILLRAALSDEFTRIEARRRAAGQPDLDEQAMGVAARESLMVELAPKWDDELLKVLGSYFAELPQPTPTMSPLEQIKLTQLVPKIPASDTAKVLARSSLGEFTVADLLADWRRLSSVYRPHIQNDEGVRALAQNSLFERIIRKAANNPALVERPEVAAVIADRIEYHGVARYLQNEVVERIPRDSLTLLAHYRAHRADFDRPARAVLVLLTLDDRHSADSLARRFTVTGEAESLAFRAQKSGANYTHVATLASDSALYRRALRLGPGAVAGPDSVDSGWQVFRVLSLDPRTVQPFASVRQPVERAWYELESERRIRALLDELKRNAHVQRNEPALRALVLSRPPARR